MLVQDKKTAGSPIKTCFFTPGWPCIQRTSNEEFVIINEPINIMLYYTFILLYLFWTSILNDLIAIFLIIINLYIYAWWPKGLIEKKNPLVFHMFAKRGHDGSEENWYLHHHMTQLGVVCLCINKLQRL